MKNAKKLKKRNIKMKQRIIRALKSLPEEINKRDIFIDTYNKFKRI
jgi:hypothetical protein